MVPKVPKVRENSSLGNGPLCDPFTGDQLRLHKLASCLKYPQLLENIVYEVRGKYCFFYA